MASIIFFTKPGCLTAAKQIKLLEQSGHQVVVRDLLAHPWNTDELLSYFDGLPVKEWFNGKSPRVKSGEIDPAAYGRDDAIALMLTDHLLIHRPLIESSGIRICGFDPTVIHNWLNLGENVYEQSKMEDYISCSLLSSIPQQCP